jgi:hypothetical protein
LRSFWKIAAGAAALALITAYAIGGLRAASGLSLGISGSLINLVAWWAVIGFATRTFATEKRAGLGGWFIALALFLKLPVFVAFWLLARKFGDPAPTWFMIGLGLVYSGAVGWSLAKR